MTKTANEYLKEPFSRVLIPDQETGTYTAKILEFPGCIAQGNTPAEAYRRLEEAAKGWIDACLSSGKEIPTPQEDETFSGRILLRLPKSLHREAARLARKEGVSLNQLLVSMISSRATAASLFGEFKRALHMIAVNYSIAHTTRLEHLRTKLPVAAVASNSRSTPYTEKVN